MAEDTPPCPSQKLSKKEQKRAANSGTMKYMRVFPKGILIDLHSTYGPTDVIYGRYGRYKGPPDAVIATRSATSTGCTTIKFETAFFSKSISSRLSVRGKRPGLAKQFWSFAPRSYMYGASFVFAAQILFKSVPSLSR